MNILLIDTQTSESEELVSSESLASHRFDLTRAQSVADGISHATTGNFSAIIVRDPDDAALETVGEIRKVNGSPLMVLRKGASSEASIALLEAGADDVIAGPPNIDELAARIRSMARRCTPGKRDTFVVDDLELSPKDYTVSRGGKRIMLTNREFDLLEYLMENRDRVLSRSELADQVWGDEVEWNSNVIDVSIGRLRAKIQHGESRPLIHTVTGRGYLMSDAPPLSSKEQPS